MTRRYFWIGLFVLVGGCVALTTFGGDDEEPVSAGSEEACQQFRLAQENPPTDRAMVDLMLDLAELDTSRSIHSAAINLADQLEQGSRADVQEAVGRMDAACSVSGL